MGTEGNLNNLVISQGIGNVGSVVGVNPMMGTQNLPQQAPLMQYRPLSLHQQQQQQPQNQQRKMINACMSGPVVRQHLSVSSSPLRVFGATSPLLHATSSGNQMALSSPLMGTLSDTQTPGCKRVASGNVEMRQNRMIASCQSAVDLQAWKQEYTNELESRVSRLVEENERLKKQKAYTNELENKVSLLEKENERLKKLKFIKGNLFEREIDRERKMGETLHPETTHTSNVDGCKKTDSGNSELIASYKRAFRQSDFEKAAEMLRLREEKLKIVEEMKAEEMLKHELEFNKKLQDLEKALMKLEEENEKLESNYRASISEHEKREKEAREHCLVIDAKLVELGTKYSAVQEELEKYKRMCRKLEEETTHLQKHQKMLCESKQCLQEKVVALGKDLEKKEGEERERQIQYLVDHSKLVELDLKYVAVGAELQNYKRMCTKLEEEKAHLEEDNRMLRGMLQNIQEKVVAHDKELKKEKDDERERLIQLKVEKNDLECSKRRILSEFEDCNSQCEKLKTQLKKYKRMCRKLEEEKTHLEENNRMLCEKQQCIQEKFAALELAIKKKVGEERERLIQLEIENKDLGCSKRRMLSEIQDYKRHCEELEACVSGNTIRHITGNSKAENVDGSLVTGEHQDREQFLFDKEVRSHRNVTSQMVVREQPKLGGIIMISDSEDETDINPVSNSNPWHAEIAHVSDNGKKVTLQNSSTRKKSDQRSEGVAKESSSSSDENHLYSTHKRRRFSKVITSETEDEDDRYPISKLMIKDLIEKEFRNGQLK